MKKTELLSPVGNYDAFVAALNGGCDAVYLGGKNFNARNSADNFTEEEIKSLINEAHIRGIKVHIALNTLYKNSEFKDLIDFCQKMYNYGADAFIIQDMGLFSLLREYDIPLHASTQMTIHNKDGAEALKEMGFERVVLSRELSLKEIEEISKTDIEIETFIHGALCVCFSGDCLLSSFLGDRSGNRGRCAQPCRLEYSFYKDDVFIKKGYLLSPKDLMSVEIADKLVKSNIDSFKIEGRMKSKEYVYIITKLYRKALEGENITQEDILNAQSIFNRGGQFTNAYYKGEGGNKMLSLTQKHTGNKIGSVTEYSKGICKIKLSMDVVPGDGILIQNKNSTTGAYINKAGSKGEIISLKIDGEKNAPVYKSYDKALIDSVKNETSVIKRQRKVSAYLRVIVGEELYFQAEAEGVKSCIYSDIVQRVENTPTDKERIIKQILKTGQTPFTLDLKYDIGDDVFVPMGSLNALRRQVLEDLEKEIIKKYNRGEDISLKDVKLDKSTKQEYTVLVNTKEQFDEVIKFTVKRIYLENNREFSNNFSYYKEICSSLGIELFMAMPYIQRGNSKAEKVDAEGYLYRNLTNRKNTKIAYDYTVNIFNKYSIDYLKQYADTLTLSCELTLDEIKELASPDTEIIVYGSIPLMITSQCPVGNFLGEKKNNFYCGERGQDNYYITDRLGVKYDVLTNCEECYALIMSEKISVIDKLDKFKDIGRYLRLNFTTETGNQTYNILNAYLEGIKDFSYKDNYAHFFKGVL